MEKKDLFELMERFERSSIQSMKLQDGEFALELQKAAAVQPVSVKAEACIEQIAPAEQSAAVGELVKAPLVGTYYAAPSPGQAPFVQVGQTVRKGEPLCLIEAMKTMNEVSAPCDLVVEELLVENGALVAYNAPILRYCHV